MIQHTLYPFPDYIRLHALVSASTVSYEPDFVFQGEQHNFWEFVYVVDGKIGATADSKIYTLSRGQIIFHRPMEFHKLWSADNSSPSLLISAFDVSGEGMCHLENGVFQLDLQAEELLMSYFHAVGPAFMPLDYSAAQMQQIEYLLGQFLLYVSSHASDSLKQQHTRSAENYRQIVRTMKENVSKGLCSSDLARLCKLSESNMKKTFHRYSGCGVMNYYTRLKISYAKQLIIKGYSVGEISDMLSFSTQNYFSLVFKRITGMSPMQFRKLNAARPESGIR